MRDVIQRNEQATGLVHLELSIVTETLCSRTPELPGEVVKYQCGCTINKSHSADSHFATALEVRFLTNLGNNPSQTWWKRVGTQSLSHAVSARKIMVNTLRIFCDFQQVVNWKPCFRMSNFLKYFYFILV